MKETAEQSRKELNLPTDLNQRVLAQCKLAHDFTEAGKFEAAREALSDVWRRVGERPDLQWLNERTRAEVLWRVGMLSGWVGSTQQIPGAQEFAKDLLSESANLFAALSEESLAAEAQIDLALCYWREGNFAESRDLLDDVLRRNMVDESFIRARALVNKSSVEVSVSRLHEALLCLTEAGPLLEKCRNHALLGRFHNQHALVLRKIGISNNFTPYTDRALMEYEAASAHFELAGNIQYTAAVETNLGNTYFALGRYDEAHTHLQRARQFFVVVKSRVHLAQVDEARAQVYLAQELYQEAEQAARSAVQILRQGDESALLVEAMTTHGRALARLDRKAEAHATIERAVAVAENGGDIVGAGKAYLTLIEELSAQLSEPELVSYYEKADEVLGGQVQTDLLERLRACTRRVFHALHRQPPLVLPGGSLKTEVLNFERELIRKALVATGGSITRSARLLQITHQGLQFILGDQHKDLLSLRTPPRPRRKSLIKKRSTAKKSAAR